MYILKILPILLLFSFKTVYGQIEILKDTLYFDSVFIVSHHYTQYENNETSSINEKKVFYMDGTLKEEYSLLHGYPFGLTKTYYENQQLKEIYFEVMGCKVGLYISYYRNGSLMTTGNYKQIDCVSDIHYQSDTIEVSNQTESELLITRTPISTKTGKWYFYNERGEVQKKYW